MFDGKAAMIAAKAEDQERIALALRVLQLVEDRSIQRGNPLITRWAQDILRRAKEEK